MPTEIHRTAMFTLPTPTQHARAALEHAFRDYTHAYGALLHIAWLRYGAQDDLAARPAPRTAGLDALRGAATYALDEKTGAPRMNARSLTNALFTGDQLPPRAIEALARLPSRLRQSAREQAGQSLMSYVALADAWLTSDTHTRATTRGGAPQFPRRRRLAEVEAQRAETLAALATLADDRRHERALFDTLLTTREPQPPAIPFVGVADDYGCGLYYNAETENYYARLDIVATESRHARPLAMRGVYTNVKTGEQWASARELADRAARGQPTAGIRSFGAGAQRLWLPLKLDAVAGADGKRESYHQRPLRFTLGAAYLPQPGASNATPAEPVSAKLVRRDTHGHIWYQLHVTFALPPEALASASADGLTAEQRPLLAINRGLVHLYAAALLTPDGQREVATFAASGSELLARQQAMEQARQRRQQRGAQPLRVRERRQARIADHEINVCANQIVEIARRERAQVVMEDLTSFASGAAIRATTQRPQARTAAFRTLLGRRQFEALHTAIDQRLALVGLPVARIVSAAYVSQTCTTCGARDTRSYAERMAALEAAARTPDPRLFVCPQCGAERDVDATAAVNIGRKLVWLRHRRDQKAAGAGDAERTAWDVWLRELLSEGS